MLCIHMIDALIRDDTKAWVPRTQTSNSGSGGQGVSGGGDSELSLRKHARSEQTGSSYSTMNNPPPVCDCLWSKQNTNLGEGKRGWQKIRLEQKCDLRGGVPQGWGKNVGKEAQRLVLWSTSGSRCGLQVFAWTAMTATNEKSGTVERQTKGTNEEATIISERICQECPLGQPLPQLQSLWYQMTEQMK